jgi:hypothetical protein
MQPPSQYRFNDLVERLTYFVANPVKNNNAGATTILGHVFG